MKKTLCPPAIDRVSRREFIAIAGATVILASSQAVPDGTSRLETSMSTAQSNPGFVLTANPSQNPGFRVQNVPNGGLLLWSQSPKKGISAYRVNELGARLWALCDGDRTPEQVAARYTELTARTASEAHAFLNTLLSIGVIVAGAKVVTLGKFPQAKAGGCYRVLLPKLSQP